MSYPKLITLPDITFDENNLDILFESLKLKLEYIHTYGESYNNNDNFSYLTYSELINDLMILINNDFINLEKIQDKIKLFEEETYAIISEENSILLNNLINKIELLINNKKISNILKEK